jgi:hypothetical protein
MHGLFQYLDKSVNSFREICEIRGIPGSVSTTYRLLITKIRHEVERKA